MATDRFIRFSSRSPSPNELDVFLEDYFGKMASVTRDNKGSWMIMLVGESTFPFARFPGVPAAFGRSLNPDRVITVLLNGNVLDVLTRMCDEATGALADGLVQTVCRFWQGTIE